MNSLGHSSERLSTWLENGPKIVMLAAQSNSLLLGAAVKIVEVATSANAQDNEVIGSR